MYAEQTLQWNPVKNTHKSPIKHGLLSSVPQHTWAVLLETETYILATKKQFQKLEKKGERKKGANKRPRLRLMASQ